MPPIMPPSDACYSSFLNFFMLKEECKKDIVGMATININKSGKYWTQMGGNYSTLFDIPMDTLLNGKVIREQKNMTQI